MKNVGFTAKGYIRKPGIKEFLQFISKAWDRVSESVVQNSFHAARVLDRDRPLPKVGDIVEVENRDLDASFIDETDFLEPDDCDADSDDDSDLESSSDDDEESDE